MSNDENKSLQQNLPLSWEEDSQNNLEEQVPPKKLLLKREEPEDDSFQGEYESQPIARPVAPKPLLLKKTPTENSEEDYRREQDNLDTIYDKEIPPGTETYEEDIDEEDWQEDETEEESSELENETDSFGVIDNEQEDDFNLGDAEAEEEPEDEIEESDEEASIEQDDSNTESSDEELEESDEEELEESSLEEDDLQESDEEASIEQDHSSTESSDEELEESDKEELEESSLEEDELQESDEEASIEQDDPNTESSDEEIEESSPETDDYANAFEDSGTFTLDESTEDEEEKTPLFEEDEIDENRVGISEGEISSSEENTEDSVEQEEIEESPVEPDEPEMSSEESVFALKADTYYGVQTELQSDSEESPTEDATPSEVIQDYDVQSLGSLLQDARLSCSFTIKDASESTRIKSSYIIALENNEMDELPPKVYILNYIRQLCREYNVPNEPMVEAFDRQSESNANGSDIKIVRVGDEDARKATKPKSKLNALLVGTCILVLLMLFLIGWYMRWFNPVATPDTITLEINLEDVRPEIKLPAPELPIPSQ